MTPKEKAKQLVDKFNDCSRIYPSFIDNDFRLVNDAKQCAFIAVKFARENPLNTNGYNKYLDEVKQEIEKL
jgi:hypothetical protein